MRMIGIGLMGFLLAGIALLLSTMNILEQGQRYVRELTTGPQLVFEHRTAATAQDADTAVILRATPDHPVILSGLPAYQSVAFAMPVDARPTSGYLQIDATSQVLDGVEGVLRISIHNTRRGEMLLRSGEAGRSLQIPLSPTDFAGNQLVVSFSLQGTGAQHQCGAEDGVEAVVEIETTSAVYLTLDRPLQTARDRVHAWGDVVHVAWPQWLKQDEQLRRLVLATQFQRRGLATVFEPAQAKGGLTTVELRAALEAFPETDDQFRHNWSMAQTGANAGVRRFYRRTVWRERYDLRGNTGQHMPTQLDLHMRFGRLLGNQHWAVAVTLNSRLVFQGHITGAKPEYSALIDLPEDIQSASNILEIAAATTTPRTGLCDQGPELLAEVLPTSRLVAGDTPFADPLSQVHAALRAVGPINVAVAGPLSAMDADAASRMLALVIPRDVDFKPAAATAHVTMLAPGLPAPILSETGVAWLITHDDVFGQLSVQSVGPGEALPDKGLALLVTPDALVLPEAKG
ncbi:hypothetical protein [uncultured Tateyamaria sp.]|uniref:hypothetical protein n=1 Tax=uncultured Tateyamaria sp. TaxID=455651 RepID=UPI002639E535|nr:hypothetical protein [uncultured Tateyamaria sp.]